MINVSYSDSETEVEFEYFTFDFNDKFPIEIVLKDDEKPHIFEVGESS